jgi:hypothetical protein
MRERMLRFSHESPWDQEREPREETGVRDYRADRAWNDTARTITNVVRCERRHKSRGRRFILSA